MLIDVISLQQPIGTKRSWYGIKPAHSHIGCIKPYGYVPRLIELLSDIFIYYLFIYIYLFRV
jgi:hypothetical protein